MVHLGLGSFHRAHQAWYTMADPEWGIAAYSFRNTELPRVLHEQDGLYSLLVRGEPTTSTEIVTSISRAHPGADTRQWVADLASPQVALITLTITEAAYRVPAAGEESALGRLVAGLEQRFRTSEAPVTIVPCDNVPSNGDVLRSALRRTAEGMDRRISDWIEANVSIANTVVDRITPPSTESDAHEVAAATGLRDRAPVVTEPFTEWLISGEFPLGRPAWERAGARFVDQVGSYQQRKLRFLNGAHSLLAYVGLARGLTTIREAAADPALSDLMGSWWNDAARHSPLPPDDLLDYQHQLRARFESPGIRHLLRDIAVDGSQKIPARLLPVLHLERERGRLPESVVTALAAWILHLGGDDVRDTRSAELVPLARAAEPAPRVLAAIDPALAADTELLASVKDVCKRLNHGRR